MANNDIEIARRLGGGFGAVASQIVGGIMTKNANQEQNKRLTEMNTDIHKAFAGARQVKMPPSELGALLNRISTYYNTTLGDSVWKNVESYKEEWKYERDAAAKMAESQGKATLESQKADMTATGKLAEEQTKRQLAIAGSTAAVAPYVNQAYQSVHGAVNPDGTPRMAGEGEAEAFRNLRDLGASGMKQEDLKEPSLAAVQAARQPTFNAWLAQASTFAQAGDRKGMFEALIKGGKTPQEAKVWVDETLPEAAGASQIKEFSFGQPMQFMEDGKIVLKEPVRNAKSGQIEWRKVEGQPYIAPKESIEDKIRLAGEKANNQKDVKAFELGVPSLKAVSNIESAWPALTQAEDLIKSGAFTTGAGRDKIQLGVRYLQTLGVPVDADKITSGEELRGILLSQGLMNLKSIVGSTQISDADRNAVLEMFGTITDDPRALLGKISRVKAKLKNDLNVHNKVFGPYNLGYEYKFEGSSPQAQAPAPKATVAPVTPQAAPVILNRRKVGQ